MVEFGVRVPLVLLDSSLRRRAKVSNADKCHRFSRRSFRPFPIRFPKRYPHVVPKRCRSQSLHTLSVPDLSERRSTESEREESSTTDLDLERSTEIHSILVLSVFGKDFLKGLFEQRRVEGITHDHVTSGK